MSVVDLSGQLVWPFRGGPYVRVGGRRIDVDPFPAYPHDLTLVERCYSAVTEACPLALEPVVFLLDREPLVRTNGWAEPDTDWDGERWQHARGQIVLAGKRIPLHPAMTRYLVAHEYGHHVEWEIAWRRTGSADDRDAIKAEYRELRGLAEEDDHANGGTWHKSVVDVFADDFRLLIAKAEVEHWPHPGVPRPEDAPGVIEWWRAAMQELVDASVPEASRG